MKCGTLQLYTIDVTTIPLNHNSELTSAWVLEMGPKKAIPVTRVGRGIFARQREETQMIEMKIPFVHPGVLTLLIEIRRPRRLVNTESIHVRSGLIILHSTSVGFQRPQIPRAQFQAFKTESIWAFSGNNRSITGNSWETCRVAG